MASSKLIILSVFLLPFSLSAETAADYVNRGAQKYIFGHEDEAKSEIVIGLAKFPNDSELQGMAGLFHNQKQNSQQQQQNQKNQKQQQSSQQNQDQQKQDQSQQQDQSGKGQNQEPEKSPEPSQAKNNSQKPDQNKDQQQNPGESPSPSPGNKSDSNQSSPSPGNGDDQAPQESPTPSESGNEGPSPSPGNGQGEDENASPTATPTNSPEKKLAGEVKGAPGEKSDKPAQALEADSNKEGQMSEQQAERLLQSMKDEEARVQLDERKAARHVYNDW